MLDRRGCGMGGAAANMVVSLFAPADVVGIWLGVANPLWPSCGVALIHPPKLVGQVGVYCITCEGPYPKQLNYRGAPNRHRLR